MKLRDYQERARAKLHRRWNQGAKSLLAVGPTGSGKTRLGAVTVRDMGRVLWVAHRRELVSQARRALATEVGAENVGVLMAGEEELPGARFQVASIETVFARSNAPDRVDVIVLDEAHHFVADSYRTLLDLYPRSRVLGLTATPERYDGRPLGDIFEQLVVAAQYSELLEQGHLVPVDVIRPTEYLGNDIVMDPLEAWDQYVLRRRNRRTFAFFGRVEEAERAAQRWKVRGVRAEVIETRTGKTWRDDAIELFGAGRLDVLANVYCLDSETELLTPRGWVRHNEISSEDHVAQWESGRVEFVLPSRIIRRERQPSERMVVLDSKRRSIRVTEGHRMLYRTSRSGAFKFAEVSKCVGRNLELPISGLLAKAPLLGLAIEQEPARDLVKAVASNAYAMRRRRGLSLKESRRIAEQRLLERGALRRKEPEELSEAECSVIGFWLGDGSVNRLRRGGVEYTLVQRTSDQGVCDWIDRTLSESGIHFLRRDNYAGLNSTRWSLPRGTGMGPQARPGVFGIEPYLIKGGTPLFWRLNKRQFDALLHGFWMAEGNHGASGDPTKKRGLWVVNTDKRVMDLLQALASCHGYRTNLFLNRKAQGNSSDLYWMTFRENECSHRCSKAGAVLEFEDKPWSKEIVWCVTVPSGALVTRRRGTVTVVGNCLTEGVDVPEAGVAVSCRSFRFSGAMIQAFGRVLRSAPGKRRALILDLTGATHVHGLPTEDRDYSLEGRAIAPHPAKMHPNAKAYVYSQEIVGGSLEVATLDDDPDEELSGLPVSPAKRAPVSADKLRAVRRKHGLRQAESVLDYRDKLGE